MMEACHILQDENAVNFRSDTQHIKSVYTDIIRETRNHKCRPRKIDNTSSDGDQNEGLNINGIMHGTMQGSIHDARPRILRDCLGVGAGVGGCVSDGGGEE